MKPEELFGYYKGMSDNRILVSFKGPVSQEVLVGLGGFVRDQLRASRKVKRIFSVFVEMTQNVFRHSEERASSGDTGVGVMVVVEKPRQYKVSSGNMIRREQGRLLIDQCERINSLDASQLKEAYQKQRKTALRHAENGAGLGLLDIGRKCDGDLEYVSLPMDEERHFFVLTATIEKERKP